MKAKNLDGMGGGIGPALALNPNATVDLNDTADGPFPHNLGMTGDSGVQGGDSVKEKGNTFYWK